MHVRDSSTWSVLNVFWSFPFLFGIADLEGDVKDSVPASPGPAAADFPAETEQLKPSSKQTVAVKKTAAKSKPVSLRRLITKASWLFQVNFNFLFWKCLLMMKLKSILAGWSWHTP